MLRRSPRNRLPVPHGLAVIGALLLLASTLAGVGSSLYSGSPQDPPATASLVSDGEHAANQPAPTDADALHQAPVKQKKRFRINLFLFRR
jgi:hypothetical protein